MEEKDKESYYDKIFQEVDSKIRRWETNLTGLFGEMNESADAYRMLDRKIVSGRPKSIFNSRVGETNRAGNTLADVWLRMITGADPYIDIRKLGYNNFGQPISDIELYGVEQVLMTQLQDFHFKTNLRRALLSLAMFGLIFIEEPWLRNKRTGREGTGFFLRSLIQTFFNPMVYDAEFSDYVGFVDYLDEHTLRWMAKSDPEIWDVNRVEAALFEFKNLNKTYKYDVWQRIIARKQRAGYNTADSKVIESITYHGKLETDNPLLQEIWENLGRISDIEDTDWTVHFIGTKGVGIYPTPYGTWHSLVKTAAYNLFELESIGNGISRTGRKYQKELDSTQSRLNDLLMMTALNMWKAGRYAGLRQGNIPIVPLGIVQVDKVEELEPLRPPIEALNYGINMMNIWKEDFRSTVGAKTSLQAIATGGTATEAGLTQVEAIRGAGVAAELIGETLIREHVETMHLNNLHLLDKEIWVNIAGFEHPLFFDRDTLPINIGFKPILTLDKNYRPERSKQILQGLQVGTSFRNIIPDSVNFVKPLIEEYFKELDIDPRLLAQPIPLGDRLLNNLRRNQRMQQYGNQLTGEFTGEASPENVNVEQSQVQTPIGNIASSPFAQSTV